MQTAEERRTKQQQRVKAMRVLRIRRRRCVDCNTALLPHTRRQRCDACTRYTNAANRACYARKQREAHP